MTILKSELCEAGDADNGSGAEHAASTHVAGKLSVRVLLSRPVSAHDPICSASVGRAARTRVASHRPTGCVQGLKPTS